MIDLIIRDIATVAAVAAMGNVYQALKVPADCLQTVIIEAIIKMVLL